jgi:hypothetical protein
MSKTTNIEALEKTRDDSLKPLPGFARQVFGGRGGLAAL